MDRFVGNDYLVAGVLRITRAVHAVCHRFSCAFLSGIPSPPPPNPRTGGRLESGALAASAVACKAAPTTFPQQLACRAYQQVMVGLTWARQSLLGQMVAQPLASAAAKGMKEVNRLLKSASLRNRQGTFLIGNNTFEVGERAEAHIPRPGEMPTPKVHPPVAELRVRMLALRAPRSSSSISSIYAAIRCGPHWARTVDRPSHSVNASSVPMPTVSPCTPCTGPAAVNWEIRLPLYDPSTLLSVGVVEVQGSMAVLVGGTPEHKVVGKARMRTSSINPFQGEWHTLVVYSAARGDEGTSSSAAACKTAATKGQRGGEAAQGVQGAVQPPSSSSLPGAREVLCLLQVQVLYPCLKQPYPLFAGLRGSALLAQMYLEPQIPEPFYYLEVEDTDSWVPMQKEAALISERWLAGVRPALDPAVTHALLEDGRGTFSLQRAQGNWTRARSALHMFSRLNAWFKRVKAWSSMRLSLEVVFCIILTVWQPSTAFALYFFLLAAVSYKRRAGSQPMDGSATRVLRKVSQEGLKAGTDVPTEGNFNSIQMLRKRYEEVLDIALTAQNTFDTFATFLERLQAIMSWRDYSASLVFMGCCVIVGLLISILGFRLVLTLLLLWQVRPPAMQDPVPPKPLSYFMRLPCLNDDNI